MLKAKQSLGQNFLVNAGVIQKILNAAEITNSDLIVEIGPGKGVLTEELRKKANRVIALEKDHRLISVLKNTFQGSGNIEIIESDVFLRTLIKRWSFSSAITRL